MTMMKKNVWLFCVLPFLLPAQNAARSAYQQQQLLDEIPRLIQQFDQLVQNQDQIALRLQKVEAALNNAGDSSGDVAALRAEVAELKSSMRRDQDQMRREIVNDLSKRMAAIASSSAVSRAAPPPPASAPATRPAPPPPPAADVGPHYEYVVEKGQTLDFIAKGFGTTRAKILAANPGLKPNVLRVGQKLIIPAEETSAAPAPKAPRKGRK